MPEISQDKLAALAATGATDREINAALGREMTQQERATVDRQRLTNRLRKAAAKRMAQPTPKDVSESINDGRSARSELDMWRARRIQREEYIAMGELVWRHQVESATAMLWEMVGNDLRYTLPGEVADRMGTPAASRAARTATREAVEVMIASWKKAGADVNEISRPTSADPKPKNVKGAKRRAFKPR